MAAKRKRIPRYSKVQINGHEYYKTDIEDADGKRVILYGKNREEVYDKEMAALEQIDNDTFRRTSPTVAEYCEKWLLLYKSIFRADKESHVIDTNPTIYLEAKGGDVPQEERQALTDEQAERLLDAIRGLCLFPAYQGLKIGIIR